MPTDCAKETTSSSRGRPTQAADISWDVAEGTGGGGEGGRGDDDPDLWKLGGICCREVDVVVVVLLDETVPSP